MRRTIGRTGIEVFPIGLGAMPLSVAGRPDPDHARRVIFAALDAGVDLIDTADSYCIDDGDTGHNEALIADALRERGAHHVTVATKGGFTRPEGRWQPSGRPEVLRRACENSLHRLGVERIDLYQFHTPDPEVPFERSVEELAKLREEGKIEHLGLSNVSIAQLERALAIVPVASVQNRCNVLHKKDLANGMVAACAEHGVAYIPYSPVGGGRGHARLAADATLREIAGAHGTSPECVALAWLLAKGDHLLPIPGASRPRSIEDSVTAVRLSLSEAEIARIDALPDAA